MRRRTLLIACAWLLGLVPPVSAQMVAYTVTVTTNGSGDATVYSPPTFGTIVAIRYVPDGSTPLDTAATLTITDNTSGLTLLAISSLGTASRDFFPRAFTMTTTGTVALYAAGGTTVLDAVPVAGAIKVVVAAGGATKIGTVYLFVQGR